MGVEKEGQPLAERVDVEPGVDGRVHVRDGVRKRKRDLLHGVDSGLADVVPADRYRVPVRQLALAERENLGDDAKEARGG